MIFNFLVKISDAKIYTADFQILDKCLIHHLTDFSPDSAEVPGRYAKHRSEVLQRNHL